MDRKYLRRALLAILAASFASPGIQHPDIWMAIYFVTERILLIILVCALAWGKDAKRDNRNEREDRRRRSK